MVEPFMTVRLVAVAFVTTRFVAVAFVVFNRVIVPEATMRFDTVVVAKVEVPVTTKVFVVVLLVVVRLVMKAVIAERTWA